MKLVFMGTPDYAATILKGLLEQGRPIALAVTQPDRPVGRKQELTPPPVKTIALEHGIKVAQPEKLDEIAGDLEALKPDAIIVAAYGQILSQRVLDIAPCYNLHASLLPLYRGAAPIQTALLNGDAVTGMAVMKMARGLDTGEMLGFNLIPVKNHNAGSLTDALAKSGAGLMAEVLDRMEKIRFLPQHGCDACYVGKVKKQHGLIDFNRSASALINAFNAYTPWPGVYLESGLQLLELEIAEKSGGFVPGAILSVDKNGVIVGCREGTVCIKTVQAPSKKPVSAADYLNGKRLAVGDLLA